MTLAAFDTGSRFTGWCVGDGQGLPLCGAWALDPTGSDIGAMLHDLHGKVADLLATHCVEAAVFEAPILTRYDKLLKIRKLYALTGHIEFVCREFSIDCHEVDLRTVKKELAGFSGAEKKDMVAAARKIGVALPEGAGREDAADAFGAWLLLLRSQNRALSSRFDAALWGSRGALL